MLAGLSIAAQPAPAYAVDKFEDAVSATWRHTQIVPSATRELHRELVRYATLAPNSHNTQPWKFECQAQSILIRPDPARRCPAVDPDDHHVWVSLGCAVENLVHAAQTFGRHAEVSVMDGAIQVALSLVTPTRSELFAAIPERQTTRSEYDGSVLDASVLRQLDRAAAFPGVRIALLTDRSRLQSLVEYITQANSAQIADPAFVAELKTWIRFNEAEALATGDGLFAGATGNPALPRWLASRLFGMVFRAGTENEKIVKQMRSSAGAVVFAGAGEHPKHWVDVGRAYQRFALQSTLLGIRNAFLNQPIEVPAIRDQFANWLNLDGARPDLVVRFGRGPTLPRSLRRPVDRVIT